MDAVTEALFEQMRRHAIAQGELTRSRRCWEELLATYRVGPAESEAVRLIASALRATETTNVTIALPPSVIEDVHDRLDEALRSAQPDERSARPR